MIILVCNARTSAISSLPSHLPPTAIRSSLPSHLNCLRYLPLLYKTRYNLCCQVCAKRFLYLNVSDVKLSLLKTALGTSSVISDKNWIYRINYCTQALSALNCFLYQAYNIVCKGNDVCSKLKLNFKVVVWALKTIFWKNHWRVPCRINWRVLYDLWEVAGLRHCWHLVSFRGCFKT